MANGNAIAKPDIGITVAGKGFAGLGEGGAGAGAKVFVAGDGGSVAGGEVAREGNGLASGLKQSADGVAVADQRAGAADVGLEFHLGIAADVLDE